MKRLVSTLNLTKEDWLRYRKCGITGTDAGAILGLNPYRSEFQVYHDKISDTIENIDNEAMRQGRDLEDYVAQRFSEETGFKVRRANAIYQSEEHPLLLADFDRLIVGQKAGLECKTVSPFSADKWADGKIPAHYLAQVDHYLAVSGFDCWYVAALIFGRELMIHKIVTDKQVALTAQRAISVDLDLNAAVSALLNSLFKALQRDDGGVRCTHDRADIHRISSAGSCRCGSRCCAGDSSAGGRRTAAGCQSACHCCRAKNLQEISARDFHNRCPPKFSYSFLNLRSLSQQVGFSVFAARRLYLALKFLGKY